MKPKSYWAAVRKEKRATAKAKRKLLGQPAPTESTTPPEQVKARIQGLIAQIGKPMPGGEP